MPDHQLLRSRFLTVYPRATSKSPASSRAHQWPGRGRRHGKRPELERAGIRRPDARPAVERHRLGDATGTMRSPQRAERGHLGRGSAVSAVNATLRTRARRICGRSVVFGTQLATQAMGARKPTKPLPYNASARPRTGSGHSAGCAAMYARPLRRPVLASSSPSGVSRAWLTWRIVAGRVAAR
jgi:hypothetical protein